VTRQPRAFLPVPFAYRQDLFQPDLQTGSLRRPNGQRVAALSREFIESFHLSLLEKFGDSVQDVLYRTGFEWGLQEMVRFNEQLRPDLGGGNLDLWQMDAKFIVESWWAPLEEAGWGRCTFDFSASSRGLVFAELRSSIIATAFNGSDQPVCHLYAGLLAGGMSFYERAERHAVEVQCAALGAATCMFVVGPATEADSVETWRQQGVGAIDILRRLR
jgi:uncharacterized protein